MRWKAAGLLMFEATALNQKKLPPFL